MELPLKTQGTVLRIQRSEASSSAIMESIDSPSLLGQSRLGQDPYSGNRSLGSLPPDVTLTAEFTSLKLGTRINESNGSSFLLLDGKENLKVFYYLVTSDDYCFVFVIFRV
jgi:hypothetical protein